MTSSAEPNLFANPMSDGELVRIIRKEGDPAASRELLTRYEKPLFNYLYRMLNHFQDVEDALQETLAKAFRALDSYQERQQFKSWIFKIARNEAINIIRKRERVSVQDDLEKTHAAALTDRRSGLTYALAEDERSQLQKAIEQLPDPEKEVLLLRLKSDMPFKEIAKITNAPLNTVLGRMHNAKKKLKLLLESHEL